MPKMIIASLLQGLSTMQDTHAKGICLVEFSSLYEFKQ